MAELGAGGTAAGEDLATPKKGHGVSGLGFGGLSPFVKHGGARSSISEILFAPSCISYTGPKPQESSCIGDPKS